MTLVPCSKPLVLRRRAPVPPQILTPGGQQHSMDYKCGGSVLLGSVPKRSRGLGC